MTGEEVLLLRFDAPLMSFGDVQVDERGVSAEFPGRSLLTGLLGNALGWSHAEADRLNLLQSRLQHAVRRDRAGELLVDYQTVDLGQPFLERGWTTRGAPAKRAGGSARSGTHIRHRHYWADAVFTVAVTLDPEEGEPDLDECAQALRQPERPLFLGRKACLPAAPLVVTKTRSPSVRRALLTTRLSPRADSEEGRFSFWWPADGAQADVSGKHRIPVHDERDWNNQIHVGRRFMWQDWVPAEEIGDAAD